MSNDYDKMKQDVDNYLSELGVTFNAQYLGETTRDDNWKCDEYRITFTRGTVEIKTDYYMGTGHRKPVKGAPTDSGRGNTLFREQWEKKYFKPIPPMAADVLYSLILDASAIDESFEDWAANFGYDTDSRKALSTYNQCCEIGQKMRRLFTSDEREKFAELTQDM